MVITQDMIAAHRNLSHCSVQFLEFVDKYPESKRRSNFQALLKKSTGEITIQPWPTFINPGIKSRFKEAALKVFSLIKSIPDRFFHCDPHKISKYYQISLDLAKFFLFGINEQYINNLIARGDFILSPSGIKCLEYNIVSNLGGLIGMDSLKYLYLNNPLLSRFLKDYNIKAKRIDITNSFVEYLVDMILKSHPDASGEINIAYIVPGFVERSSPSPRQLYFNQLFKDILHLKYQNIKGEFFVCDYIHLTIKDGYVFYKDKKVDCVFEWYGGFVPPEILQIIKNGNVFILNGHISGLLTAKLNLALLSENENSDIFTNEERDTIKKYIPWSRRLCAGETYYHNRKVDLIDFVLSNKEKFILKPAVGYGGTNVYIGCHTPEQQWQDLVESVLVEENNYWQDIRAEDITTGKQWLEMVEKAQNVKNWLVQEYVESFSYLYQAKEDECLEYNTVWGFYIFGSQYIGEFLRILPKDNDKGVINSHLGAEESTVFDVEE